ncbi:DNA mismatch repair protein [Boletus edulis]|nr:DNA mismatch repair protein [Boletus edulis]
MVFAVKPWHPIHKNLRCRDQAGSVTPELSTSPTSIDQAIRLLHGHAIEKELLHIEVSSSPTNSTLWPIGSGDVDDAEKRSAEAYCTSPNHQAKKTIFLLFINHRLVESSSVKRAIESVHSGVLPKSAFPFVYLSFEIDPRSVDVNVHPTKREVLFLNEEDITERTSDAIQQVVSQSHSRTFQYQTLLPGRSNELNVKVGRKAREEEERRRMMNVRLRYLNKYTFVGIVDDYRCLPLIQHATKLYLINHAALGEEMFYQLALMQFGSYRRLKLDPPPPLRTLLKLAVDAEPGTEKSGLSKNEIVDRIVKALDSRRDMLAEYFEINITSDGEIESLPHLMKEYTPDLNKLPVFLMRLGPQVEWDTEKACFFTLMHELAYFYSPSPSHFIPSIPDSAHAQGKAATWQTEYVLLRAMRKILWSHRGRSGSQSP